MPKTLWQIFEEEEQAMNDKTTKRSVRSDFKYARELMRQADEAMRTNRRDFEDLESIANELIACVATFSQWIEDQRDEVQS